MTPHALDGALLYFDRRTGLNVRVENEATRLLRRTAPRVVMFGITNACNLRCDFCSRDTTRASEWTVESAAEILEGLARAGTLEVAFGGGEPFAFRGFGELIARLRRTTDLALHVTTNGTLLDLGESELGLSAFDQIRLSIYEEWRKAAQKLVGKRWGANVLVDDANLDHLPALLNELAALGAADVSLLSYVGPDTTRHLTRDLSSVIRASPLPARISVCFGDSLGDLHRIRGGDCGAGLDFVTLTSDRRLQSCSFQDVSQPIASADNVLALWNERNLDAPSPRAGCRRASPPTDMRGVRIWRGFSGNNSGECILVAHFDEVAKAEKMLTDLLPGFDAGQKYAPPWLELFANERVVTPHPEHGYMPDELHTIGRTFIARTDSAMGDDFPELRALAWKRGARVQPGGIHEHATPTVVYALKAKNAKDAAQIAKAAGAKTHGVHVIGSFVARELDEAKKKLAAFDRPLAIEIFAGKIDLTKVLKRIGHEPPRDKPRLLSWFWSDPEATHAFAAEARASAVVGKLVLVEGLTRRKRIAQRALGYGGRADALEGEEVIVDGWFRLAAVPPRKGRAAPKKELDRAALERALHARFPSAKLAPSSIGHLAVIELRTTTPAAVLTSLDATARELGLELGTWVRDIDPLARAITRLLADLT